MGAYLSEPNTKKSSINQIGEKVTIGASSMQGWRVTQEDAHNSYIDFDDDVSLFAVYDGHGGHEVAYYCSKNLPKFIKNTEAYKDGDITGSLNEAFLGFDALMATPEVLSILKEIAGDKGQNEKSEVSDVEENIHDLYKEASMPLHAILNKYQVVSNESVDSPGNIDKETFAVSVANFARPYMRCQKMIFEDNFCNANALLSTEVTQKNEAVSSSASHNNCFCTKSDSDVIERSTNSTDTDKISDSTRKIDDSTITGYGASTKVGDKISIVPPSIEDDIQLFSSGNEVKASLKGSEIFLNGSAAKSGSISIELLKNSEAHSETETSRINIRKEPEQTYNINGNGTDKTHSEFNTDMVEFQNLSSADPHERNDDDENSIALGESKQSEEKEDDDSEDTLEDDEEYDINEEGRGDKDDSDDDERDIDDYSMKVCDEPGFDSGCTAVVTLLRGYDLYVANAGDSRCVLCRDGKAVELSLDHKPEDVPEMTRIIRAGGKVTSDGRVNGGLNLSRALGDHAYKQNRELSAKDQMISAAPDIRHCILDENQDEFMILACDGIWNSMSSQNVVTFVRQRLEKNKDNLSNICEELFDQCLAPNTLGDGTGCDNMTAIIVVFKFMKKPGKFSVGISSNSKRALTPDRRPADTWDMDDHRLEESKRLKF